LDALAQEVRAFVLVLEDVGLLTLEAAVVHRKAGALDVGVWRVTVAAHAVQGWGWPGGRRHLFCDNQAGYICDTLGVIQWAGTTPRKCAACPLSSADVST